MPSRLLRFELVPLIGIEPSVNPSGPLLVQTRAPLSGIRTRAPLSGIRTLALFLDVNSFPSLRFGPGSNPCPYLVPLLVVPLLVVPTGSIPMRGTSSNRRSLESPLGFTSQRGTRFINPKEEHEFESRKWAGSYPREGLGRNRRFGPSLCFFFRI